MCMNKSVLYSVLIAVAVCAAPLVAMADVIFNTLPEPYAIYELPTDIPAPHSAYGDLAGNPDTYQFTLTASTTLTFILYTLDEQDAHPIFSNIIVADEGNRGVREIDRMQAAALQWEPYQSATTKMRYRRSEEREIDFAPGTYRVEVSTPDNVGAYRMDIHGEDTPRVGYFSTLANIRAVQSFHGYAWWHLFRTSTVLTPLLFIIVVMGMLGTWWYARRHKLV